jgi:hypothetical protein
MIRKTMPLGYDPMGGYRFFLATNTERLRGDHAQTKIERDDDSTKSHPALARRQIRIDASWPAEEQIML